jgi:inhibitor of KinA
MPSFRIVAAGEAALVVELPERIDPELNAWCVALSRSLVSRLGTIVRDVVVGYCSVTVYFDPLRVDAAWLEGEVGASAEILDAETAAEGAVIDVPVCYGGDMGPDLADVAAFATCSEAEAIDLHAGREYRVYMVGFVPGFAYMAEVEPRIAAPRRASPRTAVPAGSVAIAGGQTGIYPAVTPGGWNIIGRTPLRPYDPDRPEPFLFRSGDRVRFRPVSDQELRQS